MTARGLPTGFHLPTRLCRTFHRQYPEGLADLLVIVHEEALEFFLEGFSQIVDVTDMCITVRTVLDTYDPVIAFVLFLISLFPLDDPDRPAGEAATRKSRLIHEDQRVERIAIVRLGRRHEAEVVWKLHPRRQHLGQREDSFVRIIGVLVTAPRGSLDDDDEEIRILWVEGREAKRTRQSRSAPIALGHNSNSRVSNLNRVCNTSGPARSRLEGLPRVRER